MTVLSSLEFAKMLSAQEMLNLFSYVNEMYGGKDFQALAVRRSDTGKLSVDILVKGLGKKTVEL